MMVVGSNGDGKKQTCWNMFENQYERNANRQVLKSEEKRKIKNEYGVSVLYNSTYDEEA